MLHKTAIIDSKAKLGNNNEIGPYVVIDGPVIIGNNNKIGPCTIIMGNTTIGDNNNISGHVYIGNDPQDLSYKGGETYIKIGNHNTIREFANIHRGTKEGSATSIGDNNYLMVAVHVAHNCMLGNNIIMVNGTAIGGYVEIFDHAFLSAYSTVHQFTRIGNYTICGIFSKIVQDVPPFMMVAGEPCVVRGINSIGLKRKGFDAERREKIRQAYKVLYRKKYSLSHAVRELRSMEDSEDIKLLLDFIESTRRGILLKSVKKSE